MNEHLAPRVGLRPRRLVFGVAGAATAILAGVAVGLAITRFEEPAVVGAPARPVHQAAEAALPSRLVISAIGVSARVESVGVTATGTMAVPQDPADVGWYAEGVRPGQPGDAVIDGDAVWVAQQAAFARLGDLKAGETVEVQLTDGSTLTFKVVSVTSYPFTVSKVPGLFSRTGAPRLSLVTSSSRWEGRQYQPREVVTAVLESHRRP